ncbi:thiamine-phosphate pyrophosphorylase [Sphingomonas zeicaulis]|uniref:thiamine phosphate synthase n=1 Tax=Sphingomonas zeicaulis TaxID=1632740 RepID=UPI003D257D95
MTDERAGESLWIALQRLPCGAGVIFRHHATPSAERRRLFERVRAIARRRGLMLILAGRAEQAAGWRADGVHGRTRNSAGPCLIRTAPVHNAREIARATRLHADLLLLSPVFATRSHIGARPLGRWRFAALARRTRIPVVALGGMDGQRARRMAALGAYGWAAIDAFTAPGRIRT